MAVATAHDHHDHAETVLPDAIVDVAPVKKLAAIAAAAGFVVYAICGFLNSSADPEHGTRDWFLTYLCGFIFWTSLPFGSLALSMIGFVTNATWGIIFRRIFQASIRTLPVLFVLGLPVLASLFLFGGKHSPYWWADKAWEGDTAAVAAQLHLRPEAVEEINHKRHDFLSASPSAMGGFPIRYVVYFAIIGAFAYGVLNRAKAYEAEKTDETLGRLQGVSAPGILLWALTMAIFCTDWVMSVEPTWASSMFPVVFGMNQFLTTLAFSALLFYTLNKGKVEVMAIIKEKFRIDIGSLMFGFTMLWAYSSFCQYMLVWAGNLPEEIPYYLKRGAGDPPNGWVYLSYILMLFHWFVPFIVLLFREIKTNPKTMQIMTSLLLTVCALDVVWWIVPSVPHAEKAYAHVPMALGAIVGVGGLWGLAFARELGKQPILVKNHEAKFMAEWGHH
jgi:hypothetical protein